MLGQIPVIMWVWLSSQCPEETAKIWLFMWQGRQCCRPLATGVCSITAKLYLSSLCVIKSISGCNVAFNINATPLHFKITSDFNHIKVMLTPLHGITVEFQNPESRQELQFNFKKKSIFIPIFNCNMPKMPQFISKRDIACFSSKHFSICIFLLHLVSVITSWFKTPQWPE